MHAAVVVILEKSGEKTIFSIVGVVWVGSQ